MKNVNFFAAGTAFVALFALLAFVPVVDAHHNSPVYETIEENENFDNMDMHEAAIEDVSDNSSMDNATDLGTATDTATQDGAEDGADGETNQSRMR